ncbi:VOC family protein [Thalassospira mesophila]|uniref:Glyoxalase n=1 Tax=Thalassospira mesophila TaxID=1293891 RepID=A0A1Y2L0H0_9PROT|nr:VOC family protein [Thalassospira mesophila]OSQ38739.1 glyoxalase [Thalassospira mesophila]
MDQRLSLITLAVADMARARGFYESGMGWKPVMAVEGEVTFYQMNGLIFGLYNRTEMAKDGKFDDNGARYCGMAMAYNARSTAEVDAVFARAAQAGAHIQKQPVKTDWGGYSGYFLDLDGHPWEIAHNPFWTITDDGHMVIPPQPEELGGA